MKYLDVSLLRRQPNESEIKLMSKRDKQPCCFVCKEKILEGQMYYVIISNTWMKRHACCVRKTPGVTYWGSDISDASIEDAVRRSTRPRYQKYARNASKR